MRERLLKTIERELTHYRKWECYVDENNELQFILGNREIDTADLDEYALRDLLDEIIAW